MTTGTAKIREGISLLLFLSLLGANLLPGIASTIAAPALPSISRAFADVTDVERLVPMVLTLSPLAVALSGPFIGLLVDRVGSRRVILSAAFLYAIAGTSAVVAPTLGAVLAGRFVLGLAVCGLFTSATTLIGQLLDGPARARVLAVQAGVGGVSATFFIALAGVLADVHWRAPFLIYLLALPLAVMFMRSIPRGVGPGVVPVPIVRPSVPTLPAAIAAVSTSGTPGYLPAAQRERDLRGPSGSLFAVVAVMYFGMAVMQSIHFLVALNLPFVLETRFEASATLTGVVMALLMLAFALGTLGSVRLSQLLEARATVAVAFIASGVGHLLLSGVVPGVSALVSIFPSALISGIGFGLFAPNLIAWLAAIAPPHLRGRLFGGITGSMFLGQFLAPILWAPALTAFGRAGAIAFAGSLTLVVGACLALSVWIRPNGGRASVARTSGPEPRTP